ncbi:SpoIIE family protein phosphatase [bacterium]|nr:SpoIIE family protein phosphatase [bacterium]
MGLFRQTLLLTTLMFAIILTITVGLSVWSLYDNLVKECESKGRAVALGISRSSDELLVNRDLATLQAILDESLKVEGVSYLFLVSPTRELLCHTFVPQVPAAVLGLPSASDETTVTKIYVQGLGYCLDISAPVMAGVGGQIHVGMDLQLVYHEVLSDATLQALAVLVVFLASLWASTYSVRRITGPVSALTEYAEALSGHDFSTDFPHRQEMARLVCQSVGEVAALAESFLHMERTIQQSVLNLRQTTAAKERIEGELQVARHIQMSIVPKRFPAFLQLSQLDIFATLEPSREVGGDLYDFFQLDDEHIFAVVGDVSGKGVPAALFMAVTQTLIKATARQGLGLAELMSRLNNELCQNNEASMFVTLFVIVLNVRTGVVEFSNGGHNLPYLLSPGESPAMLPRSKGMGLGVAEDVPFETRTMTLRPGQALVLYTDGISEAHDPQEELFGEARMVEVFSQLEHTQPRHVVDGLLQAVRAFEAGGAQADDITVLVLTFLGLPNVRELTVANQMSQLDSLAAVVEQFGAKHELGPKTVMLLQLAIEELFTNAVSYGFADDSQGTVSIRLEKEEDAVILTITDDARPFDPFEQGPTVDAAQGLEDRKIGGLGIHLTRNMFDEIAYQRRGPLNWVQLRKRLD